MEKTTVTIVASDGTKLEFTADTALVFTISEAADFLNGKVPRIEANSSYVGNDIPEVIFANIIAKLVGAFIQKRQENNPLSAAFNTRKIALDLLERSEKIINDCSKTQLEAELTQIKNALDGIREAASQHGGGSDV